MGPSRLQGRRDDSRSWKIPKIALHNCTVQRILESRTGPAESMPWIPCVQQSPGGIVLHSVP